METIRSTLLILFGSALVWIGSAAAVGSLLVYLLLWTGHIDWLALLADEMGAGLFVGPFLAFCFVAGICLAFMGSVIGVVRLARKMAGSSEENAPDGPVAGVQGDPATRLAGNPKSKLLLLVSVLCLCIIAFVLSRPCTYAVADACQVRITDLNHQPVQGLRVVRSWGFSLEHYGDQEGRTDSSGTVSFAPVSVEISMLKRLEMRWAPSFAFGWHPGRDSLPVTVYLPDDLAVRFDPGLWRQAIPGDSSAYTNQSGVFVRYCGAHASANQNLSATVRTGSRITRPNNYLGIGFPGGNQKVEFQVCENARSQ